LEAQPAPFMVSVNRLFTFSVTIFPFWNYACLPYCSLKHSILSHRS